MGVMLTLAYHTDGMADQEAIEIINHSHQVLEKKFLPSFLSDTTRLDTAIHKQSIFFMDGMSAVLYYRLLQQAVYPIELNGGLGLSEDIAEALSYAEAALSEAEGLGLGNIIYNANFFEDNLLNMQLINWQAVIQKQTPVARVVAFLYEVQAPLYLQGAMVNEPFSDEDLLVLNDLKQGVYANEEKLLSLMDINFSARKPSKWVEIFESVDKKKYYITGLFKRGYATAIAEMTHMTRQNIDYHFKSGRFAFERDMTATVVIQLDREMAALGG